MKRARPDRPDGPKVLSPRKAKQLAHLVERLEHLREVHPKSARAVEELIHIMADGFDDQ